MSRAAGFTVSLFLAFGLVFLGSDAAAHTKRGLKAVHSKAGCAKVVPAKKKEECTACTKQGAAYHYHPASPEGQRCHSAGKGKPGGSEAVDDIKCTVTKIRGTSVSLPVETKKTLGPEANCKTSSTKVAQEYAAANPVCSGKDTTFNYTVTYSEKGSSKNFDLSTFCPH